MNRRHFAKSLVVCMLAFLLAFQAPAASAATVRWNNTVTIYRYYTYFYTDRYVTYYPYGIAFKKYDGPTMVIKWWNCDAQGSNPQGVEATVSNSDPAPWVWLKYNGTSPTYLRFCIAILSGGNNSSDTFDGLLDWDGNN